MRTKIAGVLLTCLAALVMSGCAYGVASYGPGGVAPAIIYSEGLVYPASNTSSTVYNLDTGDFEIRGTVVAEGDSKNILGVYAIGDNGYQSLLEEARAMGADDVINVRCDVRYTNIFFFYTEAQTILTGQGVKWK